MSVIVFTDKCNIYSYIGRVVGNDCEAYWLLSITNLEAIA